MLIETPPALMTHSGFTIRARVDSQKYLPAFVAAIFQTEAIHKQAHLEGTGTNISNLSQQILSGIRLPSFTIHEQLEYLQRVGVWDSASDKSTALLALLEQRKQGLMQQLMTGRRRLKGFRGKWKTVSVGSFAANASNINKSGHALPVLSCTKYAGLVDSLSYFGKQIFSVNTNTYKLVARGQFAYATNHIEEGSIGYQSLYDAALISPMYTVFEVDAAAVDHGFLYKLLKTEAMRRVFESSTHGSVARRGSLRWPEFAKLKIAVPPLPEQTAIATLLDVASKEIELVSAEIAQLRTQKRALMQKLLSGAWRLPEAPLPQGVSA